MKSPKGCIFNREASRGRGNARVRRADDPKRVIDWAVGQRVRMEREHQSLQHEALAKKAGVKMSDISRIEEGRRIPSTSALKKVARTLNLSMVSLMAMPVVSAEDRIEFQEMSEAGLGDWVQQLGEFEEREVTQK